MYKCNENVIEALLQKIIVPVLQTSNGYFVTSGPIQAIDGDLQDGIDISYEITYQKAAAFNLTDNRLMITNLTDVDSKNTIVVMAYEGRLKMCDSKLIVGSIFQLVQKIIRQNSRQKYSKLKSISHHLYMYGKARLKE